MSAYRTNRIDVGNQPEWDRLMNNANQNPPKLICAMFTADWCGACQHIKPTFEKLATTYSRVLFAKVDCDAAKEVANSFNIKGLPTFVFFYKRQEKGRVQGADERGLMAMLTKLEKETNVFVGGSGYALNAPSVAAPAAVASAAPVSSAAAPAAPAAPRRNPWADPNWKPPSAQAAAPAPAPATSASASSPASGANAADSAVAAPVAKVPVAAAANDSRLKVDQAVLQQLLDMGFNQVRSEKALVLTQNKGLEAAMEWLLVHQDDMDIDEPLTVVGTQSSGKAGGASASALLAQADAAKPKWVAGQKGAPLGWKDGDDYEDDEEDSVLKKMKTKVDPAREARLAKLNNQASSAAAAAPVADSAASVPAQSEQDVLEAQFQSQFGTQNLSQEDKLKKFEELRANYRKNREETERKMAMERERNRIEMERKNLDLRRAMEDRDMQMAIDSKKREDQLAKERHKKIMQKIEEDKKRRQAEAAARAAAKGNNQ